MVSQHTPWLYSIIHSGRLGVDRNKGHEIVMKRCGGAGDDDDRETAGKNSFSPLFSEYESGSPSLRFRPKYVFPLLLAPSA